MRTRAVEIPVLSYDDDDTVVVDDPDLEATAVQSNTMVGIPVQIEREQTLDLDTTLRHPAESHYFVLAGFTVGADTDIIADSIAECVDPAGRVDWVIGPTWLARDCHWHVVVNLSDPDVPPDKRIAAWRPIRDR